ncbi:MAG: class I SAM-dependent RNA methyltransferase [Polyangia bacterium]
MAGEHSAATVVVEIDGLAPGGDAVGRQRDAAGDETGANGRATFVPLAAPGERVRVRIEREKGRVAWGEVVAVERPSPARVPPPCAVFGTCGGCQWQHVDLPTQRAAKQAIVARALGTAVDGVREAGPPFGYRDRAKWAVGQGGALGFRARRSHQVVDHQVGEAYVCLLPGPELARAYGALRALARGLAPEIEVEAQAGAEGVHVNVVRADPTSAGHARREVDRLQAAGITGLSIAGKPVWGTEAVDVAEPGSAPLHVPAGGFAQAGRAANAALVAAVLEAVGEAPGTIVELYAGSGNFTRHLAARWPGRVQASDGDPAAVTRGRANAPGATWSAKPSTTAADTVLLDPPREGADRAHLDVAARARRVVYVSCDPQTLGRDARLLAGSGFRLIRAVALDLMPQTFHVEVVALFERLDRDALLP